MTKRGKGLLAGGLVLIVAAVGVGLFLFFHRDNPDKVSLESATKAAEQAPKATSTTTSTTTAGGGSPAGSGSAGSGVDGTWTVDNSTGTFDFQSATGSFAGFRIDETLASIGKSEAVGRTGDVTGTATIAGGQLTEAKFDVDLTTIKTNESRRDGRVQQALETSQFPTATFKLTEPVDLGAAAGGQGTFKGQAKGDLTIHGTTKPVTFDLEAKVVNGRVVVVGSTDITFADFGVSVPQAPVVVSVADHGTVELQLLLQKS